MYFCHKCNFTSDSAMNFCPQCGSGMFVSQPVCAAQNPEAETAKATAEAAPAAEPAQAAESFSAPEAPATFAPHTEPIYQVKAPSKGALLAKKIVGMSLSIFGFCFAVLASLFSLVSLANAPASFAMALYFSFFSMPASIVGLIFSKSAINLGDTSKMSSVGKGLGLAGVIIIVAANVIALFALIARL